VGFDQRAGVRLYKFQGTAEGMRANFTVEVDMALIPGFGIQIQDLPTLCRDLLEQQVEGQELRALTLTGKEMRAHADTCALARETAKKRKPSRRPVPENAGEAWRTPLR
jgi:hypothetical protein